MTIFLNAMGYCNNSDIVAKVHLFTRDICGFTVKDFLVREHPQE